MIKKIGLIGENIDYSVSPIIHNYWLKKININAIYNKLSINKKYFNNNLLQYYLNDGYIGFNVTIPYKEKILNLADRFTKITSKIYASNTIYYESNEIIADNTDYYGFLLSLLLFKNIKFKYMKEINFNDINSQFNLDSCNIKIFKNKVNALVIGAGGAAKSVIYALVNTNINNIYIINRSYNSLINLKKIFKSPKIKIIDNVNTLNKVALVVNCTPIENNQPFDFKYTNILDSNCLFYDLIYNPIKTNFLFNAELLGYQILNGMQMLLIQAAYSFYKWFKIFPKIDINLIDLIEHSILRK